MISNNNGNEEVGLRLLVHAELEEKFNARIKGLEKEAETARKEAEQAMNKAKLAIESVTPISKKNEELEKKLREEKDKNLKSHRSLVVAEGSVESLTVRLEKQTDELKSANKELSELRQHNPIKLKDSLQTKRKEASELKKEVTELKKLDPIRLKNNLAKKKEELKKAGAANAELRAKIQEQKQDAVKYNKTINNLKENLDKNNKLPVAEIDKSLRTSDCGNFKIYPVSFESKSRPFLGDDVNYSIVDLRNGTSQVFYLEDGKVCVDPSSEPPADILKFMHAWITFGEDVEEVEQMVEG